MTRDNVVFEFGMFLASKGRQRAYAIFHQPKDCDSAQLKVMSDLLGINYPALQDEHLENRIQEFFAQPTGDLRFDERKMYANPVLWRSIRNREFEHWRTKGLYVGTQSAVLWSRIEGHRRYERYIGFMHAFIDDIANSDGANQGFIYQGIDNIVSLGPGSGKTDLALVTRIKAHNETINYVPIDVNPVLASMAATEISSDRLVRVPFLIVDDFESNHSMIKDVIDGNAHEIGHRNLFVMLGATFSNLEDTESRFFLKMKDWMSKGDYFLLDVNIYDEETPQGHDFAEEWKGELVHEGSDKPDWLSFLAHALVNKHPQLYRHTETTALGGDEQCREVLRVAGNRMPVRDIIKIDRIPTEDAKQYSHVKDTVVLIGRINDNEGASDVFFLRRYRFDAIRDELGKHFEVKGFNGIKQYNKHTQRALFLLTAG